MNARIYVELLKTLLVQKIYALGLVVSEKKIFHVFPIISIWQIIIPKGMVCMDPRDAVARIYKKKKYYTEPHIKYNWSGPCGFTEVFFFLYFYPL